MCNSTWTCLMTRVFSDVKTFWNILWEHKIATLLTFLFNLIASNNFKTRNISCSMPKFYQTLISQSSAATTQLDQRCSLARVQLYVVHAFMAWQTIVSSFTQCSALISRFEFQIAHPILSATLTTADWPKFFNFISLTKTLKWSDKNWAQL